MEAAEAVRQSKACGGRGHVETGRGRHNETELECGARCRGRHVLLQLGNRRDDLGEALGDGVTVVEVCASLDKRPRSTTEWESLSKRFGDWAWFCFCHCVKVSGCKSLGMPAAFARVGI